MRTIILLLAWLSLSASALSQNLVAYYPFNGNANDQSGNHIDPTYTGGAGVTLTTDRFGNANKAYYFDGIPGPNYSITGSYMRMPSTNLPTTNRTVSLWFYTTDVSNMPGLLGYGGNGSCGTTLLMGLNCTGSGQYWVQGHCGANPVVYTYSTAPVNNWYHWVLTINGSTQKIYVNGELKSSANTFSGSTATAGVDFALGAVTHTNGLSPYTDANVGFFQGKLDDVRIYDDAMTDAQVQDLYASEAMVAYFPFNGNAVDETGNGNNSTYTGSGVTITTDRFGNANKAYYFDGAIGSYIRVPADKFPTTDRTISFWFNADQLGYYIPTPFSYGGNGCNNSLLMIINHYNYANSYLVESHCGANVIAAPYTVEPVNKWYHLTLTINGTTQKIFVNGVLQQSTNSFTSPTFVTGTAALLGACINTDGNTVFDGYFRGKLDEYRIYNTAMTDAQVLALHTTEAGTPPVAYYPFNGNANDESGNGYNGTVSGATLTADRFYQAGKAYNFVFNGFSSDKIQVPGTSSFNFSTGGFSLSAWVNFSGTAGPGNNYPIFSKHNCGEQSGYILMLFNDKLTFWLAGAGGYNVVTTPDNYTDGKWHHVVAVYDGTTQYIYTDGTLKNSAALVYTNFNTANWALGGYNGCNGGFNGKVDEIKVFNRPITSGEINSLYNKSATDMVAYYPFNGNANDESGNDNNGVVTGTTLTTDRFGNTNKAYHFNGVNNFISVADNPELFSDELTLSWWYKVPEYSGTRVVIGWVNGGNRYQQFFSNNSLAYFNGYYNSCCYFNPTYANMTIVNQWQHVAVTYKKTNANESVTRLYINGELKQTDNHAAAITYQPGSAFFIGKTHDGGYFNGELDEIRVYKRLLSPNEILQLADVPVQPELLAYYPLNGNTNDMSGNGRNGTPYGGAVLTTDKYDNANSAYYITNPECGISLGNTNNLDFVGQPFAISAWVKYSNIPAADFAVVAKHNCGAPNGYALTIFNNAPRFYLCSGGNWSIVSSPQTYNDSKWHHLVATYDVTGSQKLYVDGELKAATSSVVYNSPGSGAPIIIGDAAGNCGGATFSAGIDEVKIYGSALDAAQVTALFTQSRGSGNALLFAGNSPNHVLLPGPIAAPPTFFLEAWVKRNAVQTWQWLFSGTETNTWQWGLNGNTMIFGKVNGGGPVVSNNININDNRWHHLAVTYDGTISEARFYCDGVGEGVGSISSTGIIAGTYSIGNRSGTMESFDGYIDEVRIGDGAKDINTIRNWMCRKPTTDGYSGLGFYYNFDEQTINTAYDVKGGSKALLLGGPQYVASGAPVGDISAHDFNSTYKAPVITIRPLEIFTATETTGGMFGLSVYVVKDPPANKSGVLGLGSNDYYVGVYASYGTNPQYSATYDYTGNPFVSPATEPTLQLFKRNDNSAAAWINSGAILNTTANTLTVTGQNTEYILGSFGFALPVTLLNFKVQKANSTTAALSWQTASEINNRGFEIQRSFDGSNFLDVKFVNGAGNVAETINYNTTDVPGKTGRVYYRLKQVDMDGNSRMSNIVSVLFDKTGSIKLYPNPTQQYVIIEGIEKYSRVQVVDETGRLVKEISNEHQYQLKINLAGLLNGNYFTRLVNENETAMIRFVISN